MANYTNPRTLIYWKDKARKEIFKWLTDESYSDKITAETMKDVSIGPFTKFLYHFAHECESAGWGVMVDFNERSQRIHLVDKYYKWMHKLRDEIQEAIDKMEEIRNENPEGWHS